MKVPLQETHFFTNIETASVARLCTLAQESMPKAWVLAESPREVFFRSLGQGLDQTLVTACQRVIIFDAVRELRLEKMPGATEGCLRDLREDDAGKPAWARDSAYLGRPDAGARGKLVYREYFIEDKNGMLVMDAGRLAGFQGEHA